MKATFRSRIFRLLLLFAALPAVILAAIGYYLAVETPFRSGGDRQRELSTLTDYYNETLYRDIEAAMLHQSTDSTASRLLLDFVLTSSEDRLTQVARVPLPPDAVARILEAADQRERGFLEYDHRFYQYVRRNLPPNQTVTGGIVHDSAYGALLASVQQTTTNESVKRRLQSSYVVFLGGLFVLVALVTFFAALILSRRVSRRLAEPLMALSNASIKIASGDFSQQVAVKAEGEIALLIENFNRMAANLDRTTTRLAQTERVAAWRQVARRFAHELKNPLQPILISLYRIEKQLSGTPVWEQIKEPLAAVSEEVRHLTSLADRFSALAKLPPPKLERVDLGALVASVAELYRDQLAQWQFACNLPAAALFVRVDESYLREALHNLLQNARDATPVGGRITLAAGDSGDYAQVQVEDTGAGMDADTLAAARLPYFTTKQKGTGLGLAIVEKSIAEMGGEVHIASQPGTGTRVTIQLPKDMEQ
jgi:nitrogen fixation/metabolism regulation signal transduction histidine kinase